MQVSLSFGKKPKSKTLKRLQTSGRNDKKPGQEANTATKITLKSAREYKKRTTNN